MCTPTFVKMGFKPFFGAGAAQAGERGPAGLDLKGLPLSAADLFGPSITRRTNNFGQGGAQTGRTAQRSTPTRNTTGRTSSTSTRVSGAARSGKSSLRIAPR